MSELKCPFCGELLKDGIAQINNLEVFRCPKCFKFANESTWQELIRTRKALDVAVDALKRLEKELYFNNAKQTGHIADSVMSIPSVALEQITALEQKDVK